MNEPGQTPSDSAVLAAFELHPEAVVVFSGDDLVVTAMNARARSMAGAEVLGRPAREALPHVAPALSVETLTRVLHSGESLVTRAWWLPREAPDPREDSVHDVQLVPFRPEGTEVRGVIAYGVDAGGPADAMASARRRDAPARGGTTDAELAAAVQSALLPESLPVLPGLDTAASYVLVDGEVGASGDWFDVIALRDGTVALVVGDVVGHGIEAAAVMGRLRSVLEERLGSGVGAPEAVAALDRFAAAVDAAVGSTVCVMVLDPATGELSYVTAGHPTPLVVGPDRSFRYLERTGAPPLGIRSADTGVVPGVLEDRLTTDEVVVLYSDGVVERPGRVLSESTVELGSVTASAYQPAPADPGSARPLRAMCESIMEQMVVGPGLFDDATVLLAALVDAPRTFHETAVVDRGVARTLREALDAWLRRLDVRSTDRVAVATAMNELVTNAWLHAYAGSELPADQRTVSVSAELSPAGLLQVTVSDRGRWSSPEGDLGGRGLVVAGGITDWLRVRSDDTGTDVILSQRLCREVSLLSAEPVRPQSGLGASGRSVLEVGAGKVVATGSLSVDNSFELRAAILRAGRSGTDDVVVDLSQVTFLASAAVEVLAQMLRRAADHRRTLHLVAPWGTAAQLVLDLVGLPYVSEAP